MGEILIMCNHNDKCSYTYMHNLDLHLISEKEIEKCLHRLSPAVQKFCYKENSSDFRRTNVFVTKFYQTV